MFGAGGGHANVHVYTHTCVGFFKFAVLHVLNTSGGGFYVWCKVRVRFHFEACGHPAYRHHFLKRLAFAPRVSMFHVPLSGVSQLYCVRTYS